MKGALETFMGIPIIGSPLIPEFKPVLELSNNVNVSVKFRIKCNKRYLEMFGEKQVMYMISGKYIANPKTIALLKNNLAATGFQYLTE